MNRQPNLLYVFTDEQAARTMAAYGNTQIETPHLNRLAAESVVFDKAYVTQSVCTPSRSTLLTGLYPHTNGCIQNNVPLPEEIPCLPELGDFRDYAIAYHGKWHLGDEIFAQHGFQEWISIDDGYREHNRPGRDSEAHSTYYHWLVAQGFEPDSVGKDGYRSFSRGFCARLPEEYSKPFYLGSEASRFIREHKDRPCLHAVNFFEPHMPYYGPRDGQYDPADIPLPPNFAYPPTEENPLKTRLYHAAYRQQGHSGLPLQTEDHWRRLIANYWGLCSLVDTHLGRILRTLVETGLYDDTIIIYTSDHGDMMGSHQLTAKCTQFEECATVPLLVRVPGVADDGRHVSAPVSQIDLVPTILDAIGQRAPDGLQGSSLLPFLRGEQPSPPEGDVVVEWQGNNNGFGDRTHGPSIVPLWRDMASEEEIVRAIGDPVRTVVTPEGWKYTWSTIGEDELYHLGEDPYETRNRYRVPGHEEIVADLRARIRRWQERTGDTISLPD